MEVHHHPQVARKNFREYFLEFLMIFLAVTLGFFAESTREYLADRTKEKEYINSFIQNLKDDTSSMSSVIEENKKKAVRLEKLMSFSHQDIFDPQIRTQFYNACEKIGYYSLFKSNDATMLQLKNSGGLRLIKNIHVADSISEYDNDVKIIYAAEALYSSTTDDALMADRQVLDLAFRYDSSYFKGDSLLDRRPPLITNDPQKIKVLFNMVDLEIGATNNYIRNIETRMPFAKRLIGFLSRQYHLQDE